MKIIRSLGMIALAGAMFWLTLAMTVAQVMAGPRPRVALAWWPWNGDARAGAAAALIEQNPSAPDTAGARRLAEAALRADPTNVVAARTLGVVASYANDRRKAQRLLRYAESLSRRDLATELWLIEDRVTDNDIGGALLHYDRALRVSSRARDILFPILVNAAADPNVAGPLARLLAGRPPWWGDAANQIILGDPSPQTMLPLVWALRLHPGRDPDQALLDHALTRFVDTGNFSSAMRLYRAMSPRGWASPIRNGGFADEGGLGPFDWQLIDEPDLRATIQPRDEGPTDPALWLDAQNGRNGQVARQLLTLHPGRFQLSAVVGNVSGDDLDRPVLLITCANAPQRQLARMAFPDAPGGGRPVHVAFAVPAQGCPVQWIRLSVGSELDAHGETPWIDAIGLTRQ